MGWLEGMEIFSKRWQIIFYWKHPSENDFVSWKRQVDCDDSGDTNIVMDMEAYFGITDLFR